MAIVQFRTIAPRSAFGSLMRNALLTFALTACSIEPLAARTPPLAKVAPAVAVAASVETPSPVSAVPEKERSPLMRLSRPHEDVGAPDVAMDAWKGFGVPRCSYLAPKEDFVAEDGAVDVIFHFHAGQMSDREMRTSGVRGVFVSCGYGIGTGGYSRAFEDPTRFGWMVSRLTRTLARAEKRDVHLGRLALVSWSAGFAAVSKVLSVPEWYEKTDTVVLLDSLHARYDDQGNVDTKGLGRFIRFASDAKNGTKTMVITHTAIMPQGYASTTEATATLLDAVGVAKTADDEELGGGIGDRARRPPMMRGMRSVYRADEGGLHVRGFLGTGPHDHFDHLHLIDDVLRRWYLR